MYLHLDFIMSFRIITVLLFFFSLSCKRDKIIPVYEGLFFSGWNESLIDTNIHVSEGELLDFNGMVCHFFRLDSAKKHVSSSGSIAFRTSSDKGRTWSKIGIVYNSIYDDRNVLAKVINSTVVLVFRRYNPAGFMIDLGYMTSTDLVNWSPYKTIERKLNNGQPFGEITELNNSMYSFLTCDIGRAEIFTFTNLLEKIESKILYDYKDKYIDEPYLVKTMRNNYFILARDEFHPYPNDSSYFLFQLADINDKPNYLGRSGMNANQINVNRTAPYLHYISRINSLLAISVQRKYFSASHDSVFFYLGHLDSIYNNSSKWKLIYSVNRPIPDKKSVIYGYPKLLKIANDEYLGMISERYNSSSINFFSNEEYVGFYSFYIKLIQK